MKVTECQPYFLSIKSRIRAPHDPIHFLLLLNHRIAEDLQWLIIHCLCLSLISFVVVVCPPGFIGSLLLHKLSTVVVSEGYSSLQGAGFSLQWLLLLPSMDSQAREPQQLQHRGPVIVLKLKLLQGIWDLPGSGIEPISPALAGRPLSILPLPAI